MPETMNLAQKIAAARAKLGSLQPDKVNKDQNYKYISADKILERAGDVLANLGVAIIPSVVSENVTVVERQGGKSRIDAALKMSFQITDGEGEFIAHWTAWGSDYLVPDKAVYKAITSGHKYFLMKLLNVGVGNEDGEHETPEPEPTKTAQPAPSTERKPAAADNVDIAFPRKDAPAQQSKSAAPADADKTSQEFRHKALWTKAGKAGLLTKENMEVWRRVPGDTSEEIAARCELMHIALDPTYGSEMPDPRTGDGENR